MGFSPPPVGQPAEAALQQYYERLLSWLGPQRWWPARTRFEIILGAILTQNTSWKNVQKALRALRVRGWLRFSPLSRLPRPVLAQAIRSAGFYQQKATTIRHFILFVRSRYGGSLERLFREPTFRLRPALLSVNGFGPETVDSILLYAGRRPIFVVDACTRRILSRHGLMSAGASYEQIQTLFHRSVAPGIFNEYHALLVEVGKRYCKHRVALCGQCPLEVFLPGGAPFGVRAESSFAPQGRSGWLAEGSLPSPGEPARVNSCGRASTSFREPTR